MSDMDDALQTFIAESRDLLEQMEDALLRVEQSPDDPDIIAAIFRAAHTIKGSAGLFGIDYIVSFTHVAESVLDKVRNHELHVDSDLVALLLAVCDHLGALVNLVAEGATPNADITQASEALIARLRVHLGQPQTGTASALASSSPQPQASLDAAGPDHWHISLRFGPDVLRNGMDPLAFIRYLGTFGTLVHVLPVPDAVPRLGEMDPETSYLGYEINFETTADKATIEGAFEFVRDDAQIHILPPNSHISEYLRLIDELPEEDLRLGEILVLCGSITRAELDRALQEQQAEPAKAQPIGEMLVAQKSIQPQVVNAALDKQQQNKDAKEHKAAEGSLIRVNAEKLDEHINLIGELIIASASASLISQRANIPELQEAAARLSRLVEEVRDSALTLRMVQIGATFNKFQRVVRDMSAELGKDIRLEISGAETELDKTVVEKIGDPLTHLVRNSLDHGIEAAEIRTSQGKPAHGTIRLNAYHDSGSIVIEVSDDGGGLNKERIRAKAIEKELIKPDQLMSDSELYNLIFEAGFSTAEKVNNLSGRGVGMDVVRRNITALRGTVEIESAEGVGTTMRVRLPLTLAIIDGFLVGVGGSSFVVPLEMVEECVELSEEELEASQGRNQLNLRGEVLPYIRIKDLFDISDPPPPSLDSEDEGLTFGMATLPGGHNTGVVLTPEGIAALAADPELDFILHPVKRENVVVVKYAGRRAGLVVESLMGEFQTVIRPLGMVFNGLNGISGFTLLGDGRVALILDVPGLVKLVATDEHQLQLRSGSRGVAAP